MLNWLQISLQSDESDSLLVRKEMLFKFCYNKISVIYNFKRSLDVIGDTFILALSSYPDLFTLCRR